ncbi:MAG TPA: hypothetical protein PLE77_07000 [Kiritimatiellia bacterium]|nr:hypothetical protein [Kiritimatiellia bacterium]
MSAGAWTWASRVFCELFFSKSVGRLVYWFRIVLANLGWWLFSGYIRVLWSQYEEVQVISGVTTRVVPDSVLLQFYAGQALSFIYGSLFVVAARLRHLKLMRWYVFLPVLATQAIPYLSILVTVVLGVYEPKGELRRAE